jgi:hypothetical protein
MELAIRKATLAVARQLARLLQGIGWFEAFKSADLEASTARVGARLRECFADKSHSIYVAEVQPLAIVGYGSVHWLPYLFMSGP